MNSKQREQMIADFQRNLISLNQQRVVAAAIEVRQEKAEHARKLELASASAPKITVKVYS